MTDNNTVLFELKVYSDKQVYKTRDKIKIWATLEYIGDKSEIKIWHGEPYIIYSITNGKDFNLDGLRHMILKSTLHLLCIPFQQFPAVILELGGQSRIKHSAQFIRLFISE